MLHYTRHYIRSTYLNELYHYGIRGQRWGFRRFQNADGTLTSAGKRRYYTNARNVEYKNLNADTVKTGMHYAKSLKRVNKFTKKYNRAVDKGASTQKIDKLRAKKKDAEASEHFWKSQNKNSIDAVIQSRAGKAARGKLREEKVSKIPTRILKNGEKILKGFNLNSDEFSDALYVGDYWFGTPGVLGSSAASHRTYRNDVEFESNFNRNKNYNKYKERKKSGYYKNK